MMPSCGLIYTAHSWITSYHTLHNIVSSFWENHEKYKYVVHNNIEKIRRYYCYKFVDHFDLYFWLLWVGAAVGTGFQCFDLT